jgi:zinc/manganese transport system permease protein
MGEAKNIFDVFQVILPAFSLSVSLILIHVWFGLNVFERGIIFVDISLAQASFLGSISAFLLGVHDHYIFGVASAILFGLIISALKKENVVLKEAFVGVIYAMSSALSILLLSKNPSGTEILRHMLIGNILFVDFKDVAKASSIYISILIISLILRRKNLSGFSREILFFTTFGMVVTSSVSLAGVLLVFSYLIIPTFLAKIIFGEDEKKNLIFGWIFGIVSTTIGFILSITFDVPTSPTVISIMSIVSVIFSIIKRR